MRCFEVMQSGFKLGGPCPYRAKFSVVVPGQIHFVCGYHKRVWLSYAVSPLASESGVADA